jgi:DNA-binding CsgD family transcriptional regulator
MTVIGMVPLDAAGSRCISTAADRELRLVEIRIDGKFGDEPETVRLTPAQAAQWAKQLAEAAKMSCGKLKKSPEMKGVAPPPKTERNAQIIRDRAAGMLYREIAAKHGISSPRVMMIVQRGAKRRGIEWRVNKSHHATPE